MLRLDDQVQGKTPRIGAPVREDHAIRRSRRQSDLYDAVQQPFGRRDILIAGPEEFQDGADALRPVGERGQGLHAADAIDLVNAAEVRRKNRGGVAADPRRPAG